MRLKNLQTDSFEGQPRILHPYKCLKVVYAQVNRGHVYDRVFACLHMRRWKQMVSLWHCPVLSNFAVRWIKTNFS